jgi:hypothetical protein
MPSTIIKDRNEVATLIDVPVARHQAFIDRIVSTQNRIKPFGIGPLSHIEASVIHGNLVVRASSVLGWLRSERVDITLVPTYGDRLTPGAEATFLAKYLLRSRSSRFAVIEDDVAAARGSVDFIELIAARFTAELAGALVGGKPLAYNDRETRDELLVRGKVNVRELPLVALTSPHRIKQRISELSSDSELSRILVAALRLLQFVVRSPRTRRAIAQLRATLREVPPIAPPNQRITALRLNASQRRYTIALFLARAILEHGTLIGGEGADSTFALLFSSWHAFQELARDLIGIAVRRLGSSWSLSGGKLVLARSSGRPALQCDPDFVVHYDGAALVTVDAKDRYQGRTPMPERAETYQIVAAARVTGSPSVALVYPGYSDGIVGEYTFDGALLPTRLLAFGIDPLAVMDDVTFAAEADRIGSLLQRLASETGSSLR